MPSGPADKKDGSAGDMAPFIIFMAFVILMTVIVISIYRINSEEDDSAVPDNPGVSLSLDARDPVVFSGDFLFPGFFHISGEPGQKFRPNLRQGIVDVRRLMADGENGRAEDMLRTLLLFYPDDIEIISMLSGILRTDGRPDEAAYYDERLSFLMPSPLPGTLPSGASAAEKRNRP